MVLQIMTQHDAIYLVGSLIMMNDGPSLLSLELALEWVSKLWKHNQIIPTIKIDFEKKVFWIHIILSIVQFWKLNFGLDVIHLLRQQELGPIW